MEKIPEVLAQFKKSFSIFFLASGQKKGLEYSSLRLNQDFLGEREKNWATNLAFAKLLLYMIEVENGSK